ncbi:MAG TPA: hypothetical protein VN442_12025 [Bryobacteraceae bacterium]|nr:hypothetical protein [Bryobacteraceae bacterium]
MGRRLVFVIFLGIGVILGGLSYFARSNRTDHLVQVRDRGQVRPTPRRLGVQEMFPSEGTRKWTGTLLDAGCPVRDAFIADTPAVPHPATTAQQSIAQTQANQQNADAAAQLVPDVRARQMDMTCAITGLTRAFAVYLPGGEVKRFDEGGNTRALEAFQFTPEGQAVLSGQAQGAKPRAEISGREQGDRIIVERVRLL